MNPDESIDRRADSDLLDLVRRRTPARLLTGRAGCSYTTATQLQLRSDHARARDAVLRELDITVDFGADFVSRWNVFETRTRAKSKAEFLLNPSLGRELDDISAREIADRCPPAPDMQIVIGDGLSAQAVAVQVPPLLPALARQAQSRGWTMGRPFIVRYCRVGVMNRIGELLRPQIVILLIGERPGMSASDSLSAYMAYQPRPGHTDADRNLISNIHGRGVSTESAAIRIAALAAEFVRLGRSGTTVKEPANQRTLLR